MKKYFALGLAALLISGCTTSTAGGQCVGVVDVKKPGKEYSLSYWNVAMAFVFSETIIVPAVVVLKDLECPR